MARIAVIGGHGKVALALERILADEGHQVSALIRNPDQAEEVRQAGATPVTADVEALDEAGMSQKLAGHDAVVWSAGAGGGDPARTYAVDRDAAIRSMEAARRAGVKRYVMVSYAGAGPDHGVPRDDPFFPYAEAKAAADAHLRSSNLAWTILAPGALTQEGPTGRIRIDATHGKVSRGDVAAIAAAVLDRPGTAHHTITFVNGETPIPEALGSLS